MGPVSTLIVDSTSPKRRSCLSLCEWVNSSVPSSLDSTQVGQEHSQRVDWLLKASGIGPG
jgi:hypothetical protein